MIFVTMRATYSSASSCSRFSTDCIGARKYRQIRGTSVISGICRMGMCSALTISKPSFSSASQVLRVSRLSKKMWKA